MPINDALGAGGNDDAENKSGNDDTGTQTGTKAGDKSKEKGGNKDDDEGDEKAGQVVFGSQKEVDDMIERRLKRALKKQKEDSELSETDRLKKEAADAKAEVRERDTRDAFIAKAGIEYGKAMRIFRMFKDDIEHDDSGKPVNLEAVLKTAKAEFPELFTKEPKKPGSGDGGSGNDDKSAGGDDMNSRLRRATGRG